MILIRIMLAIVEIPKIIKNRMNLPLTLTILVKERCRDRKDMTTDRARS